MTVTPCECILKQFFQHEYLSQFTQTLLSNSDINFIVTLVVDRRAVVHTMCTWLLGSNCRNVAVLLRLSIVRMLLALKHVPCLRGPLLALRIGLQNPI